MNTYFIEDENNIPSELLNAKNVEVFTAIGWIKLDNQEFRCGVEYRIAEWEYWSKAAGWEEAVPEEETRSLADIKRIVELEKENKELQECFDECYEELRLTRDAVEFAPRSCEPKEQE